MPTTHDGSVLFAGSGGLSAPARLSLSARVSWTDASTFVPVVTKAPWVHSAAFHGSGSLAVAATKPPNRISAVFAGAGHMSVVTIAPRLVASARFVGSGGMSLLQNSASFVVSTKHTRRLSFPINPSVPFVRRESGTYHSAVVRFAGSGRMIALAS